MDRLDLISVIATQSRKRVKVHCDRDSEVQCQKIISAINRGERFSCLLKKDADYQLVDLYASTATIKKLVKSMSPICEIDGRCKDSNANFAGVKINPYLGNWILRIPIGLIREFVELFKITKGSYVCSILVPDDDVESVARPTVDISMHLRPLLPLTVCKVDTTNCELLIEILINMSRLGKHLMDWHHIVATLGMAGQRIRIPKMELYKTLYIAPLPAPGPIEVRDQTTELWFKRPEIAFLIGMNGTRISEIRDRSGALIKIFPPDVRQNEILRLANTSRSLQRLVLFGTKLQVSKAKQLIDRLLLQKSQGHLLV